jgi:hypothetical protein
VDWVLWEHGFWGRDPNYFGEGDVISIDIDAGWTPVTSSVKTLQEKGYKPLQYLIFFCLKFTLVFINNWVLKHGRFLLWLFVHFEQPA